jgi:hypothetical protein
MQAEGIDYLLDYFLNKFNIPVRYVHSTRATLPGLSSIHITYSSQDTFICRLNSYLRQNPLFRNLDHQGHANLCVLVRDLLLHWFERITNEEGYIQTVCQKNIF